MTFDDARLLSVDLQNRMKKAQESNLSTLLFLRYTKKTLTILIPAPRADLLSLVTNYLPWMKAGNLPKLMSSFINQTLKIVLILILTRYTLLLTRFLLPVWKIFFSRNLAADGEAFDKLCNGLRLGLYMTYD